jgi:hypothetical protein
MRALRKYVEVVFAADPVNDFATSERQHRSVWRPGGTADGEGRRPRQSLPNSGTGIQHDEVLTSVDVRELPTHSSQWIRSGCSRGRKRGQGLEHHDDNTNGSSAIAFSCAIPTVLRQQSDGAWHGSTWWRDIMVCPRDRAPEIGAAGRPSGPAASRPRRVRRPRDKTGRRLQSVRRSGADCRQARSPHALAWFQSC